MSELQMLKKLAEVSALGTLKYILTVLKLNIEIYCTSEHSGSVVASAHSGHCDCC